MRRGAHRDPGRQRLRLPLRVDRLRRLVLHDVACRPPGLLPDDHRVRRCTGLEPCRHVDDVARDHRLTGRRACVERDESLTRVHGDPQLLLVAGPDPVPHGECSADGALGVVAERGRGAEDRHHGVADELLDDTSERLDLTTDPLVVLLEQRTNIFRVETCRPPRRIDQIGEQHGDDAALLPRRGGLGLERRATGEAEPGGIRVPLSTCRTTQHVGSVRAGRGCVQSRVVDREQLRAVQAPIKARYREQPAAAFVTLRAEGALGHEGISCTVATGRALVEAGLHPATGGSGVLACSGDLLLEALVACAGVTLRAVATNLGLTVGGTVRAEGDLDFRGTLGVGKDEDVPVGFTAIRLSFDLDAPEADEVQLDNLIRLTHRYCVVFQTLAGGVPVTISR